ncbi:hypothetical protein BN8_02045 [Fibrisoma limi BUZ 3]|uniref:Bacteroidetes-specific membrane protein n=2 Tax=Fibrisoma limi TaxID=663275 RepID=I2GGG9_9BACT|nr:hypothetical protein BN8_02045 [Fibrisoma limi BUZ 3]
MVIHNHVMNRLTLPVLLMALGSLSVTSHAQDPQFSQFYANPIYHNPAFAGGAGASRLILNYRNQWPALGANYQTVAASFDTYIAPDRGRIGIGWGGQAIHDRQGNAWQSNSLSGQLAPDVTLFEDGPDVMRLIGAVQATVTSGIYNPDGLSFVDQFSSGGLTNPVSSDPLSVAGVRQTFFGFSSGMVLEGQFQDQNGNLKSYWLGGTLHHIGRSLSRYDVLGQRFGLQAGLRIPLNWRIRARGLGHEESIDRSIGFTAQYRQQGMDRQLDVGVNLTYSPVMFGVWYRGIPMRKYQQTSQRDAVVLLTALQLNTFMIQYSYDITISTLSWASGGAHEISIWYGFDSLFDFSGRRANARRARKCQQF